MLSRGSFCPGSLENFVADKLAEAAAEDSTVSAHIREAFKVCEHRTYKVRSRLVAAHRLYFDDLSLSRKRAGGPLKGTAKRTCGTKDATYKHERELKVSSSSHNIIKTSVTK